MRSEKEHPTVVEEDQGEEETKVESKEMIGEEERGSLMAKCFAHYLSGGTLDVEDSTKLERTKGLIQDLEANVAQCIVCYDLLRREQSVYSCPQCFTMSHLTCIQVSE